MAVSDTSPRCVMFMLATQLWYQSKFLQEIERILIYLFYDAIN